MAAGRLSDMGTARQVIVSAHTVEVNLGRAYAKLGVRSGTQLAGRLAGLAAAAYSGFQLLPTPGSQPIVAA